MKRIILASSSPRRKELLASFGLPFDCVDPDMDETGFDHQNPELRCCSLARAKAFAAINKLENANLTKNIFPDNSGMMNSCGTIVAGSIHETLSENVGRQSAFQPESTEDWYLGADTLVWLPETEEVFGKPVDAQDALYMLQCLSGCRHSVGTGISLVRKQDSRVISAFSSSTVRFSRMTVQELEEYIQSDDWQGVAGGYRIQGHAARFIEMIEGSWSGIVGLPLRELYVILKEAGFRIPVACTC